MSKRMTQSVGCGGFGKSTFWTWLGLFSRLHHSSLLRTRRVDFKSCDYSWSEGIWNLGCIPFTCHILADFITLALASLTHPTNNERDTWQLWTVVCSNMHNASVRANAWAIIELNCVGPLHHIICVGAGWGSHLGFWMLIGVDILVSGGALRPM